MHSDLWVNGVLLADNFAKRSLYLWKEQEFKIVEEVWPTLFFIFRGGGSYFFNYFEFLLISEIKAVISESL